MTRLRKAGRLLPCLVAGFLSILVVLGSWGCGEGSSIPKTLAGSWGGTDPTDRSIPATFQVTSNGGQLALSCAREVRLSQPLQMDSSAHFSVMGVYSTPLTTSTFAARLDGAVSGNTMTLTVTFIDIPSRSAEHYTLTLGKQAPPFEGSCPG